MNLQDCGFACNCLALADEIYIKTMTLDRLKKMVAMNPIKGRDYLYKLWRHNLKYMEAALEYCSLTGIGLFRIRSDIFPLLDHPVCPIGIGDLPPFINKHPDIQLSMHPDQFCVLNSPDPVVRNRSIVILDYHRDILTYFGAPEGNICIHGGGVYGNRPEAAQRWMETFLRLDPRTARMVRLENDERGWNVQELFAMTKGKVPIIMDTFHWSINHEDFDTLGDAAELAFSTWQGKTPKIHYSEQNPEKRVGAHSDRVTKASFFQTMGTLEKLHIPFHCMLEAKHKDLALLELFVDEGFLCTISKSI